MEKCVGTLYVILMEDGWIWIFCVVFFILLGSVEGRVVNIVHVGCFFWDGILAFLLG